MLLPPPSCGVPGFGAPPSVCGGELQRAGRPGAGCWGQAEGWKHPQHPKKSLGGTSPSALTRGKAAEVGWVQVGLQGGPIQRQGPCGGCAAGGSLCFPRLGGPRRALQGRHLHEFGPLVPWEVPKDTGQTRVPSQI